MASLTRLTPPRQPAEGEEAVHTLRNITMSLRFALANLNEAHLTGDDESFKKAHSSMKLQTDSLKAVIAQLAEIVDAAAHAPPGIHQSGLNNTG